jgi:hypothetical protein
MAVDPQANADFVAQNTVSFAPGSTVFISGVQFTVVSNAGNQLILKPVTARIS